MRKTYSTGLKQTLLAIAILHMATAALAASESSEQARSTLVIGKVSDDPTKHYPYLKPMVDFVADQMNDLGITGGQVLMARDNEQMIQFLKQGRVDWVTETTISAAYFADEAGAKIILKKWKKGVANYRSIIFARTDSEINDLEDLIDHRIAFEDSGSTSAFFLPAAELMGRGMVLSELRTIRQNPPPGTIGYAFSREEINTATWVHRGLADAGVVNDNDWLNPELAESGMREEFKIIHESETIPRALELVGGHLDGAVAERLEEILIDAHVNPDAASVLDLYQRTRKFTRLDDLDQRGVQEASRLGRLVRDNLKK